MFAKSIQSVAEYNNCRAGRFYAAALTYEWTPETLGAPQLLNLAVEFRSDTQPRDRLQVKFIGVDKPRMAEFPGAHDEVRFLVVEELPAGDSGYSYRAFEEDDRGIGLEFRFLDFHAVLENYSGVELTAAGGGRS